MHYFNFFEFSIFFQLQLGMHSRALSTVQSSLPMILGHGSLFESSRARVLYSKCLVASNKGCIPTTYTAIGHLRKAFDDFMLLRYSSPPIQNFKDS